MRVIRQASSHADAVQWLGTQESLREIQQLLFPMSPLFGGNFEEELRYRTLGVMITGGEKQFNQLLDHIKPNGWVIRDGEAVSIMSAEMFLKTYTPSGQTGVPAGALRSPSSTTSPISAGDSVSIKATHPRARASEEDSAGAFDPPTHRSTYRP